MVKTQRSLPCPPPPRQPDDLFISCRSPSIAVGCTMAIVRIVMFHTAKPGYSAGTRKMEQKNFAKPNIRDRSTEYFLHPVKTEHSAVRVDFVIATMEHDIRVFSDFHGFEIF